jgi:ribonuclease HI
MSPVEPAKVEQAILRCDGASRGNPGPAAYGFVVTDPRGKVLASEGRYLGKLTNNEAEYRGLIAGLEAAAALGVRELDVRLDSELIVFQLTGRYRVRAANLLPFYQRARSLLAAFPKAAVRHVPRAQNSRADALANEALDQARANRRPSPASASQA